MPITDLSYVISAAVVPVVIISACGLLALAFYNRMAAIVTRLRAFQRERLAEQDRIERGTSPHGRQMLEHLQLQTARVKRRANLIRFTLLFLLLTIGLLIICCMMLGLASLAPAAIYAAIALFFAGLLTMLCSTLCAALELKAALEPVELENKFVSEILVESEHHNADAA